MVMLEKKYLLYSQIHDFVNHAVLDLLRIIREILCETWEVRIVDTGNGMVVNDVDFHAFDLRVEYLTYLFGGRGIRAVTFLKDVDFSSIKDFMYLLNSIPSNSNLLYHTDIQFAIHSISSIKIEEVEYGRLRYGYGEGGQDLPPDEKKTRVQLYESLKTADSSIDSYETDELVDMALEEISQMSQAEVLDFFQGLSDDSISLMVTRVQTKENSISPSLVDLLVALDSARKQAGADRLEKSSDRISYAQVNKLVEREAYESYVSEDYREYIQSLLAYDMKSPENMEGIDFFDNGLINRTIVTALIHLAKNKLHKYLEGSILEIINSYLDEFVDFRDWEFIHSIIGEDSVSSYLKQDSSVKRLSQVINSGNSYGDHYVMEIIKVSGQKNINWLMDSYMAQGDLTQRNRILAMLRMFGGAAMIQAITKIIGDPEGLMPMMVPIIEGNLGSVPRELSSRLLEVDFAGGKLLAIRILLIQNDQKVKHFMKQMIQNGDDDFVFQLLDLIEEFKIIELTDVLIAKIKTLYISQDNLRFILKTIDTVFSVDSQAFRELENRLMRRKVTLSPKNLGSIKGYLKGVCHDHKSR